MSEFDQSLLNHLAVPRRNRKISLRPWPRPCCRLSGGAQFSNSLDFCAGSTRTSHQSVRVDGSIAATSAGHSHAGAAWISTSLM